MSQRLSLKRQDRADRQVLTGTSTGPNQLTMPDIGENGSHSSPWAWWGATCV